MHTQVRPYGRRQNGIGARFIAPSPLLPFHGTVYQESMTVMPV